MTQATSLAPPEALKQHWGPEIKKTSGYLYLTPIFALLAVGGTLAGMYYCHGLPLDTIAVVSSVAMLAAAVAIAVLALRNKNLCTLGKVLTCTVLALALVVTGLSLSNQVVSGLTSGHSMADWATLAAGGVVSVAASAAAIYINHRRVREGA